MVHIGRTEGPSPSEPPKHSPTKKPFADQELFVLPREAVRGVHGALVDPIEVVAGNVLRSVSVPLTPEQNKRWVSRFYSALVTSLAKESE